MRTDEAAFLDSLLRDVDPDLRARAAMAIGRIHARTHLGALRTAAADRDTSVQAAALFALGLLKDTSALSLAAAALHRAPSVAAEGAWLLGEIGDPARVAITAALRDPSLSSRTRGSLLRAAARLRPVPVEAVQPWVADPDSAIAWRATYVLARGRVPAGVRVLVNAATRNSASVREQAARGIARSAAGDSLSQQARAALALLVHDAEPRVRINAVRSLATYGVVARANLREALRDLDAGVRVAAAQSLDPAEDSTAGSWNQDASADTAFVFQRAVADGAARRGILIDVARQWRASPEWQRRASVVSLDARGNRAEAFRRVESWMADPDGRVRAAAAGEIASMADSAIVRVEARTLLRRALGDADVGVRAAALEALASGATVDDLAAALSSHTRARADRDGDARLAFWHLADSTLAHHPTLPDSLEMMLRELAPPDDPIERAAARRLSRFAAWSPRAETSRSLAWYETRVRESLTSPTIRIETERGTLELRLFATDAPLTVYNFISLARAGYFDGQRFHRVVPNFVVQGGDPRGDGNGGPGYAIRDEINRHRYLRGTLGMALSGPDTGGSQFFITHSPQPHLDGGYTVFGQLVSGGETLDRIVQGDRIVRVTVQ